MIARWDAHLTQAESGGCMPIPFKGGDTPLMEVEMHPHSIQGDMEVPPTSLKKGCREMLYKIMLYISTSSTPQH